MEIGNSYRDALGKAIKEQCEKQHKETNFVVDFGTIDSATITNAPTFTVDSLPPTPTVTQRSPANRVDRLTKQKHFNEIAKRKRNKR